MKLITESTSTRTEWALVEGDRLVQRVFTEGINPYFQSRKEISRSIRLNLPESFFKRKISRIYFYGAGCTTDEKKNVVKASLIAQFKTTVLVESDLLAAARGLFGNEAGIACILGTGSNSCFYDGNAIVRHVRPAGYILGDEGSEAVFGKVFLSDLLKNLVPSELAKSFYAKLGIMPDDVLNAVYDDSSPTRFLVTVACFLADHLDNKYVYNLLTQNLRNFFSRNICQYDYKDCRIRFVGSCAHTYSEILKEIALEFDARVDMIKDSSLLGLIDYHARNDTEPD
jgi:N-acetylglucosamine kinase-like BadF-type ATPase